MSTTYLLYTEAKVDGKWYTISGTVPRIIEENGAVSVKEKLSTTYESGSRSYFGETYNKLFEIGRYGKFSELSDALKNEFNESLREEEEKGVTYGDLVIVSHSVFTKYAVKDQYDHHGLLHRDTIFAFENGDLDDVCGVDHSDIEDMSDEELKQYQYYEWDDTMGWLRYFKIIHTNMACEISKFLNVNYWKDPEDYRLVAIRF